MVGKQGLEPRPPGPKPGALTLTLHPVNLFLFLSALAILAGDPPLGYPAYVADGPERDPHAAVEEVALPRRWRRYLGLELN